MKIRNADIKDAKQIHDIYGTYVPYDYVTFTIDNPDIDTYAQNISDYSKHYPYLVAVDENDKIEILHFKNVNNSYTLSSESIFISNLK